MSLGRTERPAQVVVPGKWVLSGEHAVIRGGLAVTLPLEGAELSLSHTLSHNVTGTAASSTLVIEAVGGSDASTSLVSHLLSKLGDRFPEVPSAVGHLRISSTIPIGAGMGSSAALCLALSRWWLAPLALDRHKVVEAATELEDLFHGKSSGMDIAAIDAGCPFAFQRRLIEKEQPGRREKLPLKKLPHWTLTDTGQRASTRDCVARVEAKMSENPEQGYQLDRDMNSASETCLQGLIAYDRGDRGALQALASAMKLARNCFNEWGLITEEMKALEHRLLKEGALAVKPTGAGAGGALVALWG